MTLATVLLAPLILAAAVSSPAPYWESCGYIVAASNWYMRLAIEEQLPEDKIIIIEDGFNAAELRLLQSIRSDVYHDRSSLARRIVAACSPPAEDSSR